MADGNNRRAITVNLATLIPATVHLVEALFGRGNGPTKKQAATELITGVVQAAAGAAATNNPKYAEAISTVIDATVAAHLPHDEPTP